MLGAPSAQSGMPMFCVVSIEVEAESEMWPGGGPELGVVT